MGIHSVNVPNHERCSPEEVPNHFFSRSQVVITSEMASQEKFIGERKHDSRWLEAFQESNWSNMCRFFKL